ncbi:MAG: flagellar P-ring protein FlgI [Clostridiales bacterium]|nr:flagellar P-ring protein FlgI [Clostridiales bacterium]MDN5281234.1 flagellar P-ring protein FlgI [Candidatus Ozemobacter sp.]
MEVNRSAISSKKISAILIVFSLFLTFSTLPAFPQAQVRLKDIARFSGDREYQLIGYGLVTGLDGTGDKSAMSIEMIRGMLQNMGMELTANQIQTRNCAAVVVTAMLPSYGRPGESFPITISSIGDAKSLQGGVLLPTLLKGGDGQVYAVSQGQISIGGFEQGNAGGAQRSGQKNHLTVGYIPQGAIMERSVGDKFARNGKFNILLENKDSTLTRQVKEAIDRRYGLGWAKIINPGTIEVRIPSSLMDDPVSFAANIEDLPLSIDEPNRVVINERTGTVIVGNKVRISRVVISHNGIKIEVADENAPQNRNARQDVKMASMIEVNGETTVDDLVEALNAVGASPKDLIAIFQAINAAGALHGELKIM